VSLADILAASISTLSNPSEEDELDFKRSVPVNQIMTGSVETMGPEADVIAAADCMLTERVDCLPILDERHHLIGIVTGLDFLRLGRTELDSTRAAPSPTPEEPARASRLQRRAPTSIRGPALTKTSSARRTSPSSTYGPSSGKRKLKARTSSSK